MQQTKKVCSLCKISKHIDYFNKSKSDFLGRASRCKECAKKAARKYYEKAKKNPEWVKAKRIKQRDNLRNVKLEAVAYKGDKCFDCGVTYPPYIYDFHHLDGVNKVNNPSRFFCRGFEASKMELDKCVMLCSNCHRTRHYIRGDL